MTEPNRFGAELISLSGAKLLAGIESFTSIQAPLQDRPREGYLLDFKVLWNDDALKTVAAFANTFGGMLLVGISDQGGQPDKIVGVTTPGELKTSIASSIATSLHPCPIFHIAECALVGTPSSKLAVIRVDESHEVCLVTKKGLGSNPIFVRNEDESVPSNAAQVRTLLERKNALAANARRLGIGSLHDFVFTKPDGANDLAPFLRIAAQPMIDIPMRMTLTVEKIFGECIREAFRDLERNPPGFGTTFDRSSDWFEIKGEAPTTGERMRWRVTAGGDIVFLTHITKPKMEEGKWSLYDLIAHSSYAVATIAKFWAEMNYFGSASFSFDLGLYGSSLLRNTGYPPQFYSPDDTGVPWPLNDRILLPAEKERGGSSASLKVDFPAITDGRVETITEALNQLLRGLGHGVRVGELQKAVEAFTS
jgi:Putative DNA-binding domain